MAELEKLEVYACALSMPNSESPICGEWVEEIERYVEKNRNDQIYLVGHSLGTTAILRYLETKQGSPIAGAVLVSGPIERTKNEKINVFLEKSFDFANIKSKCLKFSIIHGSNDPIVPRINGKNLSKELDGELILVPNGGHLNGSAGWHSLPQCLDALVRIMEL